MVKNKEIKNFSIPKEIFEKEINSQPESKLINQLNNNNNNLIREIKHVQSNMLGRNHPILLKKISKEITEAKLIDRKTENKSKEKTKINLKDINLNADIPKVLSKNISLSDLILAREKIIEKKINQSEIKSDQNSNEKNNTESIRKSETITKKGSFIKDSLASNEFDMDKKLPAFTYKLNLDRDRFSLQNKKRKSESDSIFYQKIDHVCELLFKLRKKFIKIKFN